MKECPIGTEDRRYAECKKYGQQTGQTLVPGVVSKEELNQCLLYCRDANQTSSSLYYTNGYVQDGKV